MKIVFALALGLGVAFPLSSPAFARTTATSSTRLARRQKLASLFPQLGLQVNNLPAHVGNPKNSAAPRQTSAITPRASTTLSFSFSGFSQVQRDELNGFINSNYNLFVQVWGLPAPEQRGKTVTINNVDGASTYFPPASGSSGAGEIDFDFVNTGVAGENEFRLLKLVLNAFQGPRVPAFDFNNGLYVEPYLLGSSEAAALQILYKAQGSKTTFDPRLYADYVLPFYDAFNSPTLGNAFIYPESGDVTVSDFRLAMAQAAFLKLYTEKETFFSDFNTALYARGTARSPISTDELETLAAGVCPTVEGLPFRAWVREQGALNARVQTGNKLYLVALPSRANATGDTRPPVAVFAEAFATDASGNDVPLYAGAPKDRNGNLLAAYGTLDAFDETGRNINSFSNELTGSTVLTFNDSTAPGEATKAAAFLPFGSPAAARVTLRARLGATEGTAIFPYGAAGTTSSPTTFYGATLGGTTGTIALTSGTQTQNIPIARGTFASVLTPISGPRVKTTLSDGTKTFVRNTAWLAPGTTVRSLEFLLSGAGAAVSSSALTLNTANGRLKMIAFPLRPVARDEATALNIPASSLSLARYRPDLSPATTVNGGLQFGIGGSKYEIYPNISQSPEAGRGYWLQLPTTGLNTQVTGTYLPTNVAAEIELKGGWNQIGVPRATAIAALNVKVRYGGYSAVSLQEAQTRGWLAAGVWRYNGTGGYERVDVSGGNLTPWEGYWVFASPQTGVSLVFEPGATTQGVRALATASGSWSVGIVASSSVSRDTSASFGVSTGIPAAKPPVATRQLSVYFPPADVAASSGGGTAQGFLKGLNTKNEWHFAVEGATRGERVTLSWPNFTNAPANLQLQLRNDANGGLLLMKSGGNWTFTSDGKPHQFSIVGTLIAATTPSVKGS
ncbi:hypothetical protein IAD21_05903 [Abditibacteriota bacterium]|nr:hypothetical protein IAD21_05903 [Abditibacteriota bacterium]